MNKKNPKIVFLHGLPGSGKSTVAEEYIANHPDEEITRINRDDIRTIRFGEKYHYGTSPASLRTRSLASRKTYCGKRWPLATL